MAPLKWIVSHLAASFVISGVLAAPSPQTSQAATPEEPVDIAADFVAELISNATQAEEEILSSRKRFLTCSASSDRVVSLGYAKYQGAYDAVTGLNTWKGSEHLIVSRSHTLTD